MRRQVILVVSWAIAVVVAITVGLAGVRTVGDTVRGRGLLGSDSGGAPVSVKQMQPPDQVNPKVKPEVNPDATVVTDGITDEFGTFVVTCQGVVATTDDVRPNKADGWSVVSFEPGPDEDVDATFRNGFSRVDIEVFCNRGRPTVAELEYDRLTGDDDD